MSLNMADQRFDEGNLAHLHSLEVLAKGAGVTLAGRISGRVLALANQVLIARLLGPASYGLFALGWGALRLSEVIAPLGLNRAVIRFGGQFLGEDPDSLRKTVQWTIALSLVGGGVLGAALFIAAPWLADSLFREDGLAPVLRAFAATMAIFAGLIVTAAATTISQDMRNSVKALELLQPAAQLILLAGFLALGWQLMGAVTAVAISMILALAMALNDLRRIVPGLFTFSSTGDAPLRALLVYSAPVALASLLSKLLTWTDRFMVGYFLPAEELGIYQAAAMSSILFAIILSGFNSIFNPVIVAYERQSNRDGLRELYRVSTKWGLYISLPLFVVLLVFRRELIEVVFGTGYEAAVVPMVILAIGQLANVATGAVGALHTMTDYPRRWAAISGGTLAINLWLAWRLIPQYGLVGAAIANTAATTVLFGLGLVSVRSLMGLWPYDARFLKGIGATAGAIVAALGVAAAPIAQPFVRLAVAGITSAGSFALVLILLGIDSEDRHVLQVLWARVRGIAGIESSGG